MSRDEGGLADVTPAPAPGRAGKELVFLNDQILPLAEARVSVLDRGFLFGDGIYEVIRCYHGRPFLLEEHLRRLARTALRLHIPLPGGLPRLRRAIDALLAASSPPPDCAIYIQLTRGLAAPLPPPCHSEAWSQVTPAVGLLASAPAGRPTLLIMLDEVRVIDLPRAPARRAITLPDPRPARCDFKSTSLLPWVSARLRAQSAGADEALLTRGRLVLEGSGSNLFVVRWGRLTTPPLGQAVFPGLTRALVLRLAREAGIGAEEAPIRRTDLYLADEAFCTSTMSEIVPIGEIDGLPVGGGRPGPCFRQLAVAFTEVSR